MGLSRNETKFMAAMAAHPGPVRVSELNLRNVFGFRWSIGALYAMATRLEDRGLIGGHPAERSSFRLYRPTSLGVAELTHSQGRQ